jgi:hypothetical protein
MNVSESGNDEHTEGDAMTREDIAKERALKMHDLALSVVRSKGVTKLEGSTTVLEYRYGLLLIQYRSGKGELDVWFDRRVLSVERFAWKPQIMRYTPGDWERHLVEAAKVAA